jgi:gamma-glutamyltranspeptidase/glutathione hydrolase
VPTVGYAHRPVAYGTHGMVATAHPQATLTGLEILKSGGTVVDAAVAVNAVLAVTQPHMCGVGGDLFCLYLDASVREVVCLCGGGRAGSGASAAALHAQGLRAMPLTGALAVTVPACGRAWGELLARHGTRPLGALLKPAITLAAEGFPVSGLLAQAIDERRAAFDDPEWHRIYAPAGRAPRAGEMLRQPDLARTLALVGEAGVDVLYEGELAARLVARVRAGGGLLTEDDLAAYGVEWPVPIRADYRGTTVYQTPPPTQGVTLLETLILLDGIDLARVPYESAGRVHLLVEALKLAYRDRDRHLGDPDAVAVPVEALLDPAYAARQRRQIDPRRAAPAVPADLVGDTTGFVIAAADGSVIAVIQSLYSAFGSGVVPPGTGIVLHNRGAAFSLDPASPNVLAPGRRPLHTLTATLAVRDGAPVAALATMGGHAQPQTHLQVLTNLLDFGMDPQEAVERPRVVQGQMRPTDPTDRLRVEPALGRRVIEGLRRRGHVVEVLPDRAWTAGHAQLLTLARGESGPLLAGGADPRGDGLALGY